jgi:hypothetical protein
MNKLARLITISSALLICISCTKINEPESVQVDKIENKQVVKLVSKPVNKPVVKQISKQEKNINAVQCKKPRPEFCTQEYNPVCAVKFTAIQCIAKPCPSTEEKTYSSGCAACADKSVFEYKQGACNINLTH